MKSFEYINSPQSLLTPDIVAMLTSICRHKLIEKIGFFYGF